MSMIVMASIQTVVDAVTSAILVTLDCIYGINSDVDNEFVRALDTGIRKGHVTELAQVLGKLAEQKKPTGISTELLASTNAHIMVYAGLMPALNKREVSEEVIHDLVNCLYDLGQDLDALENRAMAYNIVSCAQSVAASVGIPHLKVTLRLRDLANPDEPDQVHAACWACAIERVRMSVDKNVDWLPALDAIELALSVRVSSPEYQTRLAQALLTVLKGTQQDNIQDILPLCITQIPAECISEQQRQEANRILAALARPPDLPANHNLRQIPDHVLGAIKAQMIADDLRMRLTKRHKEMPTLTWLDMTLAHPKLADAVPLGPALTFDSSRTGELVLELVHELAHAYCLNGPIGWAVQANRAVVRFFEILLSITQFEAPDFGDFSETQIMSAIADDEIGRTISEAQLAASLRSAKFTAVWLPWLEGVAQYVELLADPTENPNEIVSVHAAVRTLIDVDFSEDLRGPADAERVFERFAKEFDDFLAKALYRYSRHRHMGYLSQSQASRVYLLGYLLVRSVVAKWEKTLGRRIKPIYAAKLLIDATQRGCLTTVKAQMQNLDATLDELTKPICEWLRTLAHLDASTLDTFFEDVPRDQLGHSYLWENGTPRRVDATELPALSEAQLRDDEDYFEDLCLRYVSIGSVLAIPDDVALNEESPLPYGDLNDVVVLLFRHYAVCNRFLPVGRHYSRLIFFEGERAIGVSTRTYMDLTKGKKFDAMHRYCSVAFLVAEEEREELRRLCGKAGTARVLVTRIVDLIGDEDRGRRPASYVGLFFGSGQWEKIGVGRRLKPIETLDDEFMEVIRRRVLQSPLVDGGERKLGSLEFLMSRLPDSARHSKSTKAADGFDSLDWSESAALIAAGKAFPSYAGNIDQHIQEALADGEARYGLAELLHATGVGLEAGAREDRIGHSRAFFCSESHSGVSPFGGK